MIMSLEGNKIEKIEEFVLSLAEFKRLEMLYLEFRNNLLKRLPGLCVKNENNVLN